MIGPGVASAMFGFAAAIAGGREINGLSKHLVVGALIGVVVGCVVIGGFVFPAIAVALNDPEYPTKSHASYQVAGMTKGLPVGALLGLAAGLGYHFYSRFKPTRESKMR